MTMRRTGLAVAVLALGLAGLMSASGPAVTQTWPSNPIRIIVPFPPGGTTDQIARRVQPLLQADLKVPVIIENRSGASGAIGTQTAVTSPPDGTTFLLVFDTHAVNPSVLPNLPYDTLRDLAPIMLIGTSPMVITSHPATALQELCRPHRRGEEERRRDQLRHRRCGQPRASRHDQHRQRSEGHDDPRSVPGRRTAADRCDRRPCSGDDRVDRACSRPRFRAGDCARSRSPPRRAMRSFPTFRP